MTPEKLRNLMHEHKLNAKKTADMLHVSISSIYHWRTGSRTMPQLAWEYLLIKVKKPAILNIAGSDWNLS